MLTLTQRKRRSQSNHPIHSGKPKRVLRRNEVGENPLAVQQQVFGNQAVLRFARSCPLGLQSTQFCPFGGACHSCPARVQAKLVVGQPNDKYEQEADRIADQVMGMPEPRMEHRELVAGKAEGMQLRRQSEEEEEEAVQAKPLASQITPLVQRQVKPEEEEEESVQAKAGTGGIPVVSGGLQAKIEGLRGGGQPLSKSARAFFEPRFGCDFRGVRVHTDALASEAARAINAQALTIGHHIIFGSGQYAPDMKAGRKLLAHELCHVTQQMQTRPNIIQRRSCYWDPLDPSRPCWRRPTKTKNKRKQREAIAIFLISWDPEGIVDLGKIPIVGMLFRKKIRKIIGKIPIIGLLNRMTRKRDFDWVKSFGEILRFSLSQPGSGYQNFKVVAQARPDRAIIRQALIQALNTGKCLDIFIAAHGHSKVLEPGDIKAILASFSPSSRKTLKAGKQLRLIGHFGCDTISDAPDFLDLGFSSFVGHVGISAGYPILQIFYNYWIKGYSTGEATRLTNMYVEKIMKSPHQLPLFLYKLIYGGKQIKKSAANTRARARAKFPKLIEKQKQLKRDLQSLKRKLANARKLANRLNQIKSRTKIINQQLEQKINEQRKFNLKLYEKKASLRDLKKEIEETKKNMRFFASKVTQYKAKLIAREDLKTKMASPC